MSQKIAFINSSNAWGGLEMNIVKLAGWLDSAGYTSIICCLENSPIEQAALKANLTVEHIKKHKKYYDFSKALYLKKILVRHKIDVIFVADSYDLSIAALIKFLSKNKFKLIFQQQMLLAGKKKDVFHSLRYSFIDAWIAPLNYLKKQVLNKTNIKESKIKVIPLCIDYSKFFNNNITKSEARKKLNINENTSLLGIIGRIDKLKGQDFLIRALARLRAENYNVELLISGEPTREEGAENYHNFILELVQKEKIEKYVHFLPFTENIIEVFAALDIFTLASQNETFGMVTIEAMSLEKAILATNSGGTPEILDYGKLGYLYEPGNLEDFLEKARTLIEDKNLQAELAQKAHKNALQKYTHKAEVQQIIDIIEEL